MTKRPTLPAYQPPPPPEEPIGRGYARGVSYNGSRATPESVGLEGFPPEPPHDDRPPRKRRRPGRWIALVVVAALVIGGGYVAYNYQRFMSGVTHVDAITANANDIDGTDQNILLVGDDHRPAGATNRELAQLGTSEDGGSTNTDTMIVLHIPADGSEATLISFPRDSWVDIPGFGKNKLNAAFSFGSRDGGGDAGGARLLIQSIQNLTGLSIDHYVRVSMLGFFNVVAALGPVEVCLNNAVDDPWSKAKFPAGVSELSAKQSLAFVRQRHGLPNGDLDRQVRQQYFLSVEARKILSAGTLLNPGKLGEVLDAVSSAVETDPDLSFVNLAAQLKNLGADNINSATIPVSGTPSILVDGTSVSIVEVDTAAMPAFIDGVIGKESAYTAAKKAKAASVNVTVLNGSETNGVATTATEALAALGFQTGTPGSTDSLDTTTIQYPGGMESEAKAVAAVIPGAAVVESSTLTEINLLLGADNLTVKKKSTSSSGSSTSTKAAKPKVGTSYTASSCIN